MPLMFPAEGTAGTTDVWSLGILPSNCTVTSVKLIPDAAITANGTNYCTFTLKNGTTAVASRSWAATNSVANTIESMTLDTTLANRDLAAGDQLKLDRAVAGTGLASPRCALVVTVKVR